MLNVNSGKKRLWYSVLDSSCAVAGQLMGFPWLCWYVTLRDCSILWSAFMSAWKPAEAMTHLSVLCGGRVVCGGGMCEEGRGKRAVMQAIGIDPRLAAAACALLLLRAHAHSCCCCCVAASHSTQCPPRAHAPPITHRVKILELLRVMMLYPVDMRMLAATMQ